MADITTEIPNKFEIFYQKDENDNYVIFEGGCGCCCDSINLDNKNLQIYLEDKINEIKRFIEKELK